MLHIERLEKSYAKSTVLDLKDFTLAPGVYVVKGINGAGKSTFMQCVAGIIDCKSNISIDGISLSKAPVEYRKQIRYSEAEPLFPAFLTAHDLLKFVSRTINEPIEKADQLIENFEMRSFLKDPISTYSSGMIKKTSLLLTLLGSPKWILLDEPFTTIDQQSQAVLLEYIGKMSDKGSGFIISTHMGIENINLEVNETYEIKDKTLINYEK